MMRAELSRQRLLVVPAIDGDCFKAHPTRVLHSEMAQPPDAMHCDNLSGTRIGIAQFVVDRNARTHEGSCFFGRQFIRNCSQRRRWCDHVLGIPAIKIDARDLSIDTHRKVSTPALFAHKTMSAMPADPNALTSGPRSDVLAHCIDATRDFMTRDARILKPRPETFLDQRIAVANTACLNLHTYFAGTRVRDIALYQLPLPAGLTYLRCFHVRIHKCSSGLITLCAYCV